MSNRVLHLASKQGICFVAYLFAWAIQFNALGQSQQSGGAIPEGVLTRPTPPDWQAADAPKRLDKTRVNEGKGYVALAKFLMSKAKANTLTVSDCEMFAWLVRPTKDEHEWFINMTQPAFNAFVANTKTETFKDFARILIPAYRARLHQCPEGWKALAISNLSRLKDTESAPLVLELLAAATDELERGIYRRALRNMGYEVPFEEEKPKPAGAMKK
ncbi:hypothetical protein BH11VER1_BH11VER1_34750 [soil metagenome]